MKLLSKLKGEFLASSTIDNQMSSWRQFVQSKTQRITNTTFHRLLTANDLVCWLDRFFIVFLIRHFSHLLF